MVVMTALFQVPLRYLYQGEMMVSVKPLVHRRFLKVDSRLAISPLPLLFLPYSRMQPPQLVVQEQCLGLLGLAWQM